MRLYTNRAKYQKTPILVSTAIGWLSKNGGAGGLRRSTAEQQCVNASNGQRLYYLFALVRILLLLASAALVIAAVLHV